MARYSRRQIMRIAPGSKTKKAFKCMAVHRVEDRLISFIDEMDKQSDDYFRNLQFILWTGNKGQYYEGVVKGYPSTIVQFRKTGGGKGHLAIWSRGKVMLAAIIDTTNDIQHKLKTAVLDALTYHKSSIILEM